MKCDKCPVMEKCERVKADLVKLVPPDLEEKMAIGFKAFCPLEMAIEMNIGALGIELQRAIRRLVGNANTS